MTLIWFEGNCILYTRLDIIFLTLISHYHANLKQLDFFHIPVTSLTPKNTQWTFGLGHTHTQKAYLLKKHDTISSACIKKWKWKQTEFLTLPPPESGFN